MQLTLFSELPNANTLCPIKRIGLIAEIVLLTGEKIPT